MTGVSIFFAYFALPKVRLTFVTKYQKHNLIYTYKKICKPTSIGKPQLSIKHLLSKNNRKNGAPLSGVRHFYNYQIHY